MDDEIQRGIRDDDLRAAILLRRTGRVVEALDRLEAAWLAGSDPGRELFFETIRSVPDGERLTHAARLDRLACRGLEPAERLWQEWFPAVARIVGRSVAMQRMRAFVYEHARSAAPIALFGESGVGHHHTAKAIHELSGNKQLVVANTVARGLVEQESRPLSEGDTLFTWYLDSAEIEELAFNLAEERGARPLVGAGPDPVQWSRRIGGYAAIIEIPPLRSRLDDLALLARYLLDGHEGETFAVTPALVERLGRHTWPGNVRELANNLWRLAHIARQENRLDLSLEHLPESRQ